ncbi:MAG: retropepsin-like domain-containing protein [Solirubrobacterales bacterium]|nr:retropepsin-like domain-containing protein [Solirubrobacterales bacterium]
MRRRLAVVLLVCAGGLVLVTNGGAAPAAPPARPVKVPIVVVKAPDGAIAAAVKLTIHGHTYGFLIDTGASVTVVNGPLAHQLGLAPVGKPVKVSGVGCSSSARIVDLSDWKLAGVTLPAIRAASVKIAGAGGTALGLLGSDVLSRFGAVTIDYRRAVLTLG